VSTLFGGLIPDKKLFVCYGGHVTSESDGNTHYVSSISVARLYRVRIADCILMNENSNLAGFLDKGKVILRPRSDGDYSLSNRISEQKERIHNETFRSD